MLCILKQKESNLLACFVAVVNILIKKITEFVMFELDQNYFSKFMNFKIPLKNNLMHSN